MPCLPSGHYRLRLVFPEADGIAFGILHPGKRACGDVYWTNERLGAQRFCFFQIASDVIHADVENRVVLRFVAERGDVAVDAARFPGDHGRRTHGLDFPVEKLFVELLRFGDVSAADFEMYNGMWH